MLQEKMHMLNIIKDKAVVGTDDWTLLRLNQDGVEGETPEAVAVPAGKVIVPLQYGGHSTPRCKRARMSASGWPAMNGRKH